MCDYESESFPIKTLDAFQDVINKDKGYIVITDLGTGNKLHSTDCCFVKEDNFIQKVINNNCKNGQYFWGRDVEFGLKEYGAERAGCCF